MRPLGRLGEKSSWNSITCLVRPDVQTHGARTIWTAQNKVMEKSVKGETIPKCFGVDEGGGEGGGLCTRSICLWAGDRSSPLVEPLVGPLL